MDTSRKRIITINITMPVSVTYRAVNWLTSYSIQELLLIASSTGRSDQLVPHWTLELYKFYILAIPAQDTFTFIFTRDAAIQDGLGRRNSVRPSVCHTRALWQNQTIHCRYVDTTRNGNHSSFWHQQRLVGDAPFCLKFALKVAHPLRKTPTWTDFRV